MQGIKNIIKVCHDNQAKDRIGIITLEKAGEQKTCHNTGSKTSWKNIYR